MIVKEFKFKAKERMWREIVNFTSNTMFRNCIYRSYWHYLFNKKKDIERFTDEMYYGARPNPYAGIGHQLANWIDGLHWAKEFGLKHVHFPFSTKKWDEFLGFGYGEPSISDLKSQGYKIRRLPAFDEFNENEISLIRRIISSYIGEKVAFWPPQDHFYRDQYGVSNDLRKRFLGSPSREQDKIVYDKEKFNIAVHVRRTVVIDGKVIEEFGENKAKRWLSNDYYEKVLKQVLENINPDKPVAIYIFSTGKPEEFSEFSKYGEVRFCSDMDEYQSFAHLIFADLLITSKSSFSYKPALMNDGIKVCPGNFWHGYPQDDPKWVLCENDGTFDTDKLRKLFK